MTKSFQLPLTAVFVRGIGPLDVGSTRGTESFWITSGHAISNLSPESAAVTWSAALYRRP